MPFKPEKASFSSEQKNCEFPSFFLRRATGKERSKYCTKFGMNFFRMEMRQATWVKPLCGSLSLCTHTYTYACAHILMHTHIHAYTYTCTYTYTYTLTLTLTLILFLQPETTATFCSIHRLHVHVHIHIHIHVHIPWNHFYKTYCLLKKGLLGPKFNKANNWLIHLFCACWIRQGLRFRSIS